MTERPTDAGPAISGETTTFDDEDELLRRLWDLCSPEQKLRATSPREVLMKLSPPERTELLDRLSPALREEVRRLLEHRTG